MLDISMELCFQRYIDLHNRQILLWFQKSNENVSVYAFINVRKIGWKRLNCLLGQNREENWKLRTLIYRGAEESSQHYFEFHFENTTQN